MRKNRNNFTLLLLVAIFIMSPVGAAATVISAFPAYVKTPVGQLGNSTIRWRVEDSSIIEIWVSMDGASETLFAQGNTGAQEAPWIQANHIYKFSLYVGPNKSSLIDEVIVIGIDPDDTFDKYAPLRDRKSGLMVNKSNLLPYSQWATNPTSSTTTDVAWGGPSTWPEANYEEWDVKFGCVMNKDFVWINAYRNYAGNRFAIRTTKALLINDKGKVLDIINGGQCGTEGQPYALHKIDNEQYIIKVWGDLLDIWGNVGKRFYWEHIITPYQVVDPCWQTDMTKLRIAIRQDEAWWDSDQQWVIGGGNIDPNTNEPDGTGVRYGRYQTIAKNAGYVWTYERWDLGKEVTGCLQYGWSW